MADPAGPSRVLLDSHAFLWALDGGERLGPAARRLLEDERTEVWLSSATVWELGIKLALGRLTLPVPLRELVQRAVREASVRVLAVAPDHGLRAAELPLHHRDPFDRLLVSQAITEGLVLLTRDPAMAAYDVEVVW